MRTRVDYRASLSFVGTVLEIMAVPLCVPLATAIVYRESVLPFIVTILVTVLLGTAFERLRTDPQIGHREGFLMVGLTWLIVPVVGALPYLVAGQGTLVDPVNALFESMSGFTTTGATVVEEISFERHSRSMLLWRQLTQWLGGLGIIVLMVAILPELSVGGTRLIRREAPGITIEKFTPHIRETARALWTVYAGFTVLVFGLYYGLYLVGLAPNMGPYNAIAHAFTTMPTGGFSPEARSIETFSPAIQWVMVPCMVVAGTNFALLWHALKGRPERLFNDPEFRSYLGAVCVVGTVLTLTLFTGVGLAEIPVNVDPIPGDLEVAARQALFQAVSIVTTTGYASMDFNTWSSSAQTLLLFAMFLGGSAGSAAGSIKIVRWYAIGRSIRSELFTTVHPEAVQPVHMGGEVLDEGTVRGLFVFTLVFLALFAVSTILIVLDAVRTGISMTTIEAMSAAIATLGNVGPGFGIVGPMDNYRPFSDAAKLYMVFLMWIGRLEVLSVLVLLTPSYWWE